MTIVLKRLQAVTNAPAVYDYGWMHTLVENIAVDQKGRSCRLVENDDQWHFDQQVLRYHSGLHLIITEQDQLDDFLLHEWLKVSANPVLIHRIKVDLEEALDWDDDRRNALLQHLHSWRNAPNVSYRTGSRADYYLLCHGDVAADEVRSQLAGYGLKVRDWGPGIS